MNNTCLKKVHIFFLSVLVFIIHLPFSFAKVKDNVIKSSFEGVAAAPANKFKAAGLQIYDSLQLSILGLSRQAYESALTGLEKLKEAGKISNDNIISIADFTKSSAHKRLFVIDLQHHTLLFNTYVAHGQKSGTEFANSFSNLPESYQSSPGFYETADTYNGKNGYSLHLNGLENGINNNAGERAIVMHGAPYVSETFIRCRGYIGRSWGCPAVPEKLSKPIIDKIKNGSCLFIYSENTRYLSNSKILNS